MLRIVTPAALGAAFFLLVHGTATAQGTGQAPAQGEAASSSTRPAGPVDSGIDTTWRQFRRRSPSRTAPYGHGGASNDDWGFRNPGHVGRMAEYYPPGDAFQNAGAHPEAAQFSQGPASTRRGMQLQSQMVGISRYNAIQGHIDRYGMPRVGFGYGFGFGGLGAFPY